jgi:carbon monoxide dehydrogenase subunit G
MVRFEGDRTIARPLEEVWAKLTDARFLVKCIPDVESVGTLEPDHAAMVLRPSLVFMRGTLDVDLRIVDVVAPASARVINHSKGIGSTSTVEARLNFSSAANGTLVHWMAEVKELGGLLKMVPQGLIRGAAQKVITDAWATVEAKIADGANS